MVFSGEKARREILYEEMHPYGTSAYRSAASAVEVSARRYRYTGKERDEETGLDYFGARYYAPWLGRWTTADPLGLQAGLNLYEYCRGSPVVMVDPNGTEETKFDQLFRLAQAKPTFEEAKVGQQLLAQKGSVAESKLPGDIREILAAERASGAKSTVLDRIAEKKKAEFNRAAIAEYEKWRETNPLSDSTNPRSPNYSLFTPRAPQSGSENMALARRGFFLAHPPGDGDDMLAAMSDFLVPTPGAASAINETATALKIGFLDLSFLLTGASGGSFGSGRALLRGRRGVPFGFKSEGQLRQFGQAAEAGLKEAGLTDAVPILQGSAVTGRNSVTRVAFDVGRRSDLDVALSSPSLLDKARAAGVEIRAGGNRTGPLQPADIAKLGLGDLQRKLTTLAGREVKFMVYQDVLTATRREPSLFFPK